jgi:glutamyl-tRNA synthetase
MSGVYRFAPSPTGYLHVGGARTAIFNWLLARKGNGKFLIRIEDTDQKRSTAESLQNILTGLQWLGLYWDGEPVFQSSRHPRHLAIADKLVNDGNAYYCFCDKNEENGNDPCKFFSAGQIKKKLAERNAYTIRIKIPQRDFTFKDGVLGKIKIDHSELNDFIIVRSDHTPVYQLAVVVDDYDMGVTHIMRGADHLANTAKQMIIYQALGWKVPDFSHLPLILSTDKSRLSKRHGAVSVEEFRRLGILPDALFNYLCLLGWSPGDDREVLSKNEIVKLFSLERVNSHNAIFDVQKLLWMNGKYLSNLSDDHIPELIKSYLSDSQVEIFEKEQDTLLYLLRLVKQRARTLIELVDGIGFYFSDPDIYEEQGVKKFFSSAGSSELLSGLKDELLNGTGFDAVNLERLIRKFAEKRQLSAAEVIHPLRLALTGKISSPGIFDIMQILGKDKVLRRIDRAVHYIRNNELEL